MRTGSYTPPLCVAVVDSSMAQQKSQFLHAPSVTHPRLAFFTRRMYFARVPPVAVYGGMRHLLRRIAVPGPTDRP